MADIEEKCPCKKTDCPRYGDCRECVKYHVKEGKKPPACICTMWIETN